MPLFEYESASYTFTSRTRVSEKSRCLLARSGMQMLLKCPRWKRARHGAARHLRRHVHGSGCAAPPPRPGGAGASSMNPATQSARLP